MRILLLCMALLMVQPALAIVERPDVMPEDFSSPEEKQRFRALTEVLRCTVCQNQNLADSHASLARDLRHEILGLMHQGKSDEEIIAFLVARYGEFVRYRPPFNARTAVLWIGPFVFFVIALGTLVLIIRRRNRVQPAGALNNEEQAALQETLQSLKNAPDADKPQGNGK